MATKLQETINGMGGNIKPLLDELNEIAEEVKELQEKRDEVTARINEKRARVKALGVSKKAFDFGMKRKAMDEEEREKLDDNYSIVCEALGVPLKQGELNFEPVEILKGNDDASEEKSIGEQQAEAIQAAAAG